MDNGAFTYFTRPTQVIEPVLAHKSRNSSALNAPHARIRGGDTKRDAVEGELLIRSQSYLHRESPSRHSTATEFPANAVDLQIWLNLTSLVIGQRLVRVTQSRRTFAKHFTFAKFLSRCPCAASCVIVPSPPGSFRILEIAWKEERDDGGSIPCFVTDLWAGERRVQKMFAAAVGPGEARIDAEPNSAAIRTSTTALIVIDMQRDL